MQHVLRRLLCNLRSIALVTVCWCSRVYGNCMCNIIEIFKGDTSHKYLEFEGIFRRFFSKRSRSSDSSSSSSSSSDSESDAGSETNEDDTRICLRCNNTNLFKGFRRMPCSGKWIHIRCFNEWVNGSASCPQNCCQQEEGFAQSVNDLHRLIDSVRSTAEEVRSTLNDVLMTVEEITSGLPAATPGIVPAIADEIPAEVHLQAVPHPQETRRVEEDRARINLSDYISLQIIIGTAGLCAFQIFRILLRYL